MPEQRFPPFLSGPSLAAAALSLILVLAGVLALGIVSPFWLMARDPSLQWALLILVLLVLGGGVVAYVIAAPLMLRFTEKYTPASHGQQHLPDALVTSCLKDVDFACPTCTYNLRGLQGSLCPECNTPVVVYLYGTQKVSTRWTALIISWLAIMLVTSVLAIATIWEPAMNLLRGRGGWWNGYTVSQVVVISGVALAGAAVCSWRAVVLAIPKPPHRQSICARRTAVWMAAISAACATAVSIVFAGELWGKW